MDRNEGLTIRDATACINCGHLYEVSEERNLTGINKHCFYFCMKHRILYSDPPGDPQDDVSSTVCDDHIPEGETK